VLPFLNLSADPENEYFADGITEDVIAHLSKIRALKVISRTSVMPFKKREQSLGQIAATLGVATIVEGSVRRAGDRVRIVAQLIDADTDEHLWVETYDRRLTDIFEIQTDVALHIAAALQAELSSAERSRIRQEPTSNVQAYQLYLQGRHWRNQYTTDGTRRAIAYFDQAIAVDPGFALAHMGLALVYAETPVGNPTSRPELAFARAKEAIARALALDPRLGEAHAVLALLKFVCDYDWTGAEQEFKRALELNPGSGDIYDHYSWMLGAVARWDEAIAMAKRAQELDPLSQLSDLASTLLRAGRVDEAIAEALRSIEFNPSYPRSRGVLGWAYLAQGRFDEAIEQIERAAALAPGDTMHLAQLGEVYGLAGRTDRARDVLKQLEDLSRARYVAPYHFAYVYTGLGDADRAMDYLEQAFAEGAGAIYGIKGSYAFASLRSHPRFTALLRRMNLA
jgi:TolB-like protein/predicted Zn-dependent protease